MEWILEVKTEFQGITRRETVVLRFSVSIICFAIWSAALASFSEAADPVPALSAELNPWGKFELGAWKRIRVTAESFNEQGTLASTNVTESKITLDDLGEDSLTLEIQACDEIAGKRVERGPKMDKQGFHGETLSPNLKVQESAAGQVEIDDRKIPCQVLKLVSADASSQTVTSIYYSSKLDPHILKRESKTTDAEGKTVLSETTAVLLSLDMPHLIDGETHSAAHLKTVQKTPKGTVVTLAVLCPDVPGGIVSHSSKELDANGRIVRRSTLELLDYGSEPEKDRNGYFGRKRASRHRSR